MLKYLYVDVFSDTAEFHERFGLAYAGGPRTLPRGAREDGAPESPFSEQTEAGSLAPIAELLGDAHAAAREAATGPDDLAAFRIGFLVEELREYVEAVVAGDLAGQLDALVDLIYVAAGNAHLQGFPATVAWDRVHRANLRKVRAARDGRDSKRGAAHDVVKPEGWKPPVLDDLVDPSWAPPSHVAVGRTTSTRFEVTSEIFGHWFAECVTPDGDYVTARGASRSDALERVIELARAAGYL